MTFKQFTKELSGKRIEGEIIKTILVSLVISLAFLASIYFFKFRFQENFISKYGFYLFFSALSFSIIMPTIKQIRTYKDLSCMPGMMVGMTIGMIAGFLPGYFVGATNGMFYGSVLGMSIGIFLGIENGKCCGIMGIMEGIMAGFMGGLMGAMTAVMMINDNVKIAGIIIFAISIIILVGLSYMVHKETSENERYINEDYTFTIFASIILISITILFMVMGPRSVLFQ